MAEATTSNQGGGGAAEWAAMLPKSATAADAFLSAGGETRDGRNTIVAVLDTGVDPGAAGLQVTTEGKVKVLAIVDCTGAGDLATAVVEATCDGDGCTTVKGATGRTLTLNPGWTNPTGVWRVGSKVGRDFYPRPLLARLERDAAKEFKKAHQTVEAEAEAAVAAWKKEHSAPEPSVAAARELAELEERVKQLATVGSEGPGGTASRWTGPVYDVVVWHDGATYRAAVDVGCAGDLTTAAAMADYSEQQQYGSLGSEIQLNYSLAIYEEGAVVNICVDAGSHGTHVAGIIGAYRPDAVELNGVAPGCQIVALKIGDARLSSMETIPAVQRALAEVVKYKCDLINMSYGEATSIADAGAFIELASEVVNKHGVIFVSSAGNAGPALSTAGAPGATSDDIFAVGAYVTEPMMKTCYSMPKKPIEGYHTNFTWTSVGPSTDGGRGTMIMAPGGAITCVPQWTLARSQLMNGTSMSSPNACGNFAMLLGALKADKVPYSVHRVQRAVKNTAAPIAGVESRAQGHGLFQVGAAYDYLMKHKDNAAEDVQFKVTVSGATKKRGIYLRNANECATSSAHMVNVFPKLHEDRPNADSVAFEIRIRLETDVDFVEIPEHFLCAAKQRGFKITVDPSGLAPGLHTGSVWGYDADAPEKGFLFSLPITIAKPVAATSTPITRSLKLTRGVADRTFVTPPVGATWMDISVKCVDVAPVGGKSTVVVHAVQLLPHSRYSFQELKNYLYLKAGATNVVSRQVNGSATVEVCVASYWSTTNTTELEVDITFHGVAPSGTGNGSLSIDAGAGYVRTEVASHVRDLMVNPSASLDKVRTPIRPTKATVGPLAAQHNLPEGKVVHQLELEYSYTLEEAGEITPLCPGLNETVYESELYGGPFCLVFDARKKLLAGIDIYPEPVKCPKGVVTIKAYLRHTDLSLLKKYDGQVLLIERKLPKKLTLGCFDRRGELTKKGAKFSKRTLTKGTACAVFVAEPAHSDLPKLVKPGDVLSGTVTYAAVDEKLPGASKRPGGFPVTYTAPPAPAAKETPKKPKAEDTRTEATKLSEAIRDLTVGTLTKLVTKDEFGDMFAAALASYPGYLPLVKIGLLHADAESTRAEHLDEVVAAADKVMALIDQAELATHFGTNVDEEDPEAMKARKEFEAKKETLVDALARKARAVGELAKKAAGGATAEGEGGDAGAGAGAGDDGAAFKAALAELKKWTKVDHKTHSKLLIEADLRAGRHGSVLKAVREGLATATGAFDKELLELRSAAFKALGWGHAEAVELERAPVDSPSSFALF